MFSGKDAIHEGYEKYRGSVFKVPTLSTANRWLIVASGPNMIEEIRKATEDELSQHDASFESFQRDYILRDKGPMLRNMGHNIVRVVRGPLTKSFPLRFEELKEEIGLSLGANIPPTEEWSTVPFYPKALSIVAQTSNRLFVGLPLCRDSDYCQIHKDTTIAFFTGTQSLNMLPAFLRPLGGRLFTKVHRSHEETAKRLASVIRERLEMEKTHGKDWEGKPDDLISWFLDVTSEEENKTLESLALGIMFINMAAIHTTSLTLTLCLFELVSRQEYMEPLRAEVEEVVEEHGWSKESMTRMQKLDSFMKESVRFAGVAAAFVERQSKTDYKLSDGTVIPKGFRVTAAASPMNSDSELYEDAKTFDGFRFAQGGDPRSQSLVTLSRDFLLFGIGRNAW
ncbi:cytochrome P450 [Coprinopsis cinerea AmutBmut pab1-1]|nr:cytochrome P450 [Coprinopsis cinerea AmutBmut pab1-1]